MKVFLYILILSTTLVSCTKEYSEDFFAYTNNPTNDTAWKQKITYDAPVHIITDILSGFQKLYVDSFNANTGGIINFNDSLKLNFPANICTGNNGLLLTGKIKVELYFLNKKGDFIRFAKSHINNNEILNGSAGFYIRLSQNGNEVFLTNSASYRLFYKANPTSPLTKLFWETVATQNNDTTYNWLLTETSYNSFNFGVINTLQYFDTLTNTNITGYELNTRKLKWLNCASFADSIIQPQRVNVLLPINFTNNNTQVYAVFKNKKTVLQLKGDFASRTFYFPKIETGTELNIISISKLGNEYYWANKSINLQNSNLISLVPEQKTITEINRLLDAL